MIIYDPISYAVKNQNSNVGLPAAAAIHLTLPTHLICRTISAAAYAFGNLIASPFSTGALERSWIHVQDAAFNLKVALYAIFAPFTTASLLPEGIKEKELAAQSASGKGKLENMLKNLARERFTKPAEALIESLPEAINQVDLSLANAAYDKLTENPLGTLEDTDRLRSDFEALKALVDELLQKYPQVDSDSSFESVANESIERVQHEDSPPSGSPAISLGGRLLNLFSPTP